VLGLQRDRGPAGRCRKPGPAPRRDDSLVARDMYEGP